MKRPAAQPALGVAAAAPTLVARELGVGSVPDGADFRFITSKRGGDNRARGMETLFSIAHALHLGLRARELRRITTGRVAWRYRSATPMPYI